MHTLGKKAGEMEQCPVFLDKIKSHFFAHYIQKYPSITLYSCDFSLVCVLFDQNCLQRCAKKCGINANPISKKNSRDLDNNGSIVMLALLEMCTK